MMGCALFAYLCANVGVKLYLRQLNQAVVNAFQESIDQEPGSSVRGACASGGFGRYARGCFAAARFLHSSAHDALGGCSLFTFFLCVGVV